MSLMVAVSSVALAVPAAVTPLSSQYPRKPGLEELKGVPTAVEPQDTPPPMQHRVLWRIGPCNPHNENFRL